MHEISIALRLIELAQAAAEAEGAARVLALGVRVGVLSGVSGAALRGAFPIAASAGACEGARLEIETIAARVRCPVCGRAWDWDGAQGLACATCGVAAQILSGGRELELAWIQVDAA